MSEQQKIAPNKDGIGYYVVEREYTDKDGQVVVVRSADEVSKLEYLIFDMHIKDDLTHTEIARELNMTPGDVRHMYNDMLGRHYEQMVEAMNAKRFEMVMRFEEQYRHLRAQQKLMPDNPTITGQIVTVLNSESKLLGLDAPQKLQIQGEIITTVEERIKTMDAEYVETVHDAIIAEYTRSREAEDL